MGVGKSEGVSFMKRVKRLYLSVERVDDRVIATKGKNQCTIDRYSEEK